MKNETSFIFKIDKEILKNFQQCCQDNDQTAAQVLRNAIREYIIKNRQTKLKL